VIADTLARYDNHLVPFVLIGLGGLILADSRTLENPGLAVLTLILSGLYGLKLVRTVSKTLQAQQLEVLSEPEKL
jgi:hypothetical protein